jgi:hypothetical protein
MFTQINDFILSNINLEDYNVRNAKGIISTVHDIFISEYGHEIKRQRGNKIKAFKEYLMGLPTCLSVPFYYYDINPILKGWNLYDSKLSDSENSDKYFEFIAIQFMALYNFENSNLMKFSLSHLCDSDQIKNDVLKQIYFSFDTKFNWFLTQHNNDFCAIEYQSNEYMLSIHEHDLKNQFIVTVTYLNFKSDINEVMNKKQVLELLKDL